MKSILSFLFALVLVSGDFSLVCAGVPASTTTTNAVVSTVAPPDSLPVYSKAAITDYALGAARTASAQLWSESMIAFTGERRWFQVSGNDADAVIKQLQTKTFDVRVYDATKPVYLWGQIGDENGDLLFYSSDSSVQTESNGLNALRLKDAKMQFRLNWQIPIPVAGVTDAYVAHKSDDGSEWHYDLWVSNGKIHFPREYVGTQGTLVVTIGGNQIAYNLGSGKKITSTTVSGSIISAIENHIIATDAGIPTGQPLKVAMQANAPAVSGASWDLVTPPTATLTITTLEGNKRICYVSFLVKARADLGSITAWAHRLSENGLPAEEVEYQGVVTTTSNGGDVTITATWSLDNTNQDEQAGSRWGIYFEVGGYEIQAPPPSPYDGGAKG